MKKPVILLIFVVGVIFWCYRIYSSGKILEWSDEYPHRKGTATSLYIAGRLYQIRDDYVMAIPYYSRIAERYPDSRYGEEALYGWAKALRMKNRSREAAEKYYLVIKKYPNSKHRKMIENILYQLGRPLYTFQEEQE